MENGEGICVVGAEVIYAPLASYTEFHLSVSFNFARNHVQHYDNVTQKNRRNVLWLRATRGVSVITIFRSLSNAFSAFPLTFVDPEESALNSIYFIFHTILS